MLRRVGKIKIRKIDGLGLRGISKVSQTSCGHSRLWSTAAGTHCPEVPRAGPTASRTAQRPGAGRAQASARSRPASRDPPGGRQRPTTSPGAAEGREPVSAPSLSPRPALPAGRSCPACGERPAVRPREVSGSRSQWVAHLSYLHPPRPTSFPCPRPLSCSPRFRRSPPPSHRDGSSPSYPLENGLAFSSRAVVSHSRRPAQPLPLQWRARRTPRPTQRPSAFWTPFSSSPPPARASQPNPQALLWELCHWRRQSFELGGWGLPCSGTVGCP